jgi:hypothetical protein
MFPKSKKTYLTSPLTHILLFPISKYDIILLHTKLPLTSLKLSLETPPRTPCAQMGR